ncbi:MAG: phospholipase D family protein [Planctomycetes bacterium]|nr:phospholipase D family protein [Planctomycetota bacterium]
MDIATVTTADQSLLHAVRSTLEGADEVILCVAFVHDAGVRLLEREFQALRERRTTPRLLVTTTFGTTSAASLSSARALGIDVRVLNPGSRQTYHPKIYLGAKGSDMRAVIGSANLTGGLFSNVEVAVSLRGARTDSPLASAWRWANDLWQDRRVETWNPPGVAEPAVERLEPELLALIDRERLRDPVFRTLGRSPRPNRVVDLCASAVYVETERSRQRHARPEEIPAWMFNLAWERLRTHGKLTNTELLNGLRVHRSSAVCAILGRLEPVRVVSGASITLTWPGNYEAREP